MSVFIKTIATGVVAAIFGLLSAMIHEEVRPATPAAPTVAKSIATTSTPTPTQNYVNGTKQAPAVQPVRSTITKSAAPTISAAPTTKPAVNAVTQLATSAPKMPGALILNQEGTSSTINSSAVSAGSESVVSGAPAIRGVLQLTNAERVKRGLTPLTENDTLLAIARTKANDMISRQYFAHVAPDGADIGTLTERFGYAYLNIGENLALGNFASSGDIVSGWMDSPGHRANILSQNFSEIGISVIRGTYEGKSVWFAVQEFGRPQSACPAPSKTLEQKILLYEDQLKQLDVTLANLKNEFSLPGISGADYRQKVDDYNTIVDLYNKLVAETKTDVATYNASVQAFNQCAGTSPAGSTH